MTESKKKKKTGIGFSRLNPKFLIPTALLLAATFLVIILIGIRENQNNMLRMLKREGQALMESVFISGQNTIRASTTLNDAVIDNVVDVATLLELDMEKGGIDSERLNLICQMLGFNRIDIVDSSQIVSLSNYTGIIGQTYESSFLLRLPLGEIIRGSAGVVTFVMEATDISSTDQLVAAVSSETRPGAIIMFMNYQKLDSFNRRIGIGHLIRSIGGQPGIDYIFLQSKQGVVLSSRKLHPVLAMESDQFLEDILEQNKQDSRRLIFENRDVLEICRPFISTELPPGVLRIGLSLDGYHQVARNFITQVTVLGVILFLLTFLFITIVMANQNYRSVAEAYEQFKNITSNILGGIENAVVAVDSERKIVMINPKTEKIFGLKAGNCIGKNYHDIFKTDSFLLDQLALTDSDSVIKEIEFSDRENKHRFFLVTASRLIGQDNAIQGEVGVGLDITARKKLELQAKQSERLSELGSLAAGVAHEIRNPLNAIAIASQRLKAEYKVVEDQTGFEQLASTIKSEIERLNAIIVEFLALARSGQLNKEKVNLQEYLLETLQLLKNEAKISNIEIVTEIESNIELPMDSQEMKKVIGNLIKNAFEVVSDAGRIIVRANSRNGMAFIEIEDNGSGVSEADISKIFTPYFTTKEDGTGLGLPISYRIVNDHNGTLTFENVEPHGARFIIALPLVDK
jgi:PAS domain S-box-containing protein